MLPAHLQNPFLSDNLDNTVKLPPGNVPELHAAALERCISLFTQAGQSKQSLGLLVKGEAGVGKSHMIAQLRHQLAAIPSSVLVSISLRGAYAGALWRNVRKRLVEELLRPYSNAPQGSNGLLRILRNRFPKWAAGIQTSSSNLMDWLLGRSSTKDNLQPFLDEFARENILDYQFHKVLPKVGHPDLSQLAHSWLAGAPLSPEDLQKLGLQPVFPSEQEQESFAREVVRSLIRLAADQTVLFLCFDEVEAIQSGTYDPIVLRQFTTLATELVAEPGSRVVATFVRPNTLLDVSKAVEVSNQQKLFQFQLALPPLTWEQSVRVVVSRLEAEPTCRAARQSHSEDLYWPLGREFLETEFNKHKRSMTPRHLIRTCAVKFQSLQTGSAGGEIIALPGNPDDGVIQGGTGPTPPALDPSSNNGVHKPGDSTTGAGSREVGPEPEFIKPILPPSPRRKPDPLKTGEDIARMWEKQRKKLREKVQGIPFDTTMSIGLPWLVKITGNPLEAVHDIDPRLDEVNLVFRPTGGNQKPLGICYCNHDSRHLWRRLQNVLDQWKTARDTLLSSLTVLRFGSWLDTPGVKTRRTEMHEAGIRAVLIEPQQLAEFAAFQTLLTASLSGDMTRSGLPVEAEEYSAWAKENLSPSVKEFLDQLFGLPAAPKSAAAKAPEAAAPVAKKSASSRAHK